MNYFADKETKRTLAVGIEPRVLGDTYYRVVLPDFGVAVHTGLEETCEYACSLI
jgi:hypothetical protein